MRATWSDILTLKDNKYDQQDYLIFTISIGFEQDSCSDGSSDFNDNPSIIKNWCEEYQFLLNTCVKVTIAYE